MPDICKQPLVSTIYLASFVILIVLSHTVQAYEGIETYYIRYDVKSSGNKIVAEKLSMVPSENDFRVENFSQVSTKGEISAASGESKADLEKRIRENALKNILTQKGLTSIKTKDLETVISYEGAITTPLHIVENTYHGVQNNYIYKVTVEFSPIAFPDKWERLNMGYKIKKMFHNFFQYFK